MQCNPLRAIFRGGLAILVDVGIAKFDSPLFFALLLLLWWEIRPRFALVLLMQGPGSSMAICIKQLPRLMDAALVFMRLTLGTDYWLAWHF